MTLKFSLGQMLITATAQRALNLLDVQSAIMRHQEGDWGYICDEDRLTNEQALKQGLRLMSVYRDRSGTNFWIITEADRSVTTILLPEDY